METDRQRLWDDQPRRVKPDFVERSQGLKELHEGSTGEGAMILPQFLIGLILCVFNAVFFSQVKADERLDYSLDVSFDLQASKISGVARIRVNRGQELKLERPSLHLIRVTFNQQKIDITEQDDAITLILQHPGTVEIVYEAVYQTNQGHQLSSNVIGDDGVFLTTTWYPRPEQMCFYHLTAAFPEGYEAVSEAESIERTSQEGKVLFSFLFPYPLESIDLIATNRYKVVREDFHGTEILVYFFGEDSGLIPIYLEHAKKYLALYDRLVLHFPYKRFSIVENFLPTGYSMPTFTLLGQEVVRLPFIPETSLGHEILHQWFGNLVYIDDAKGNWAEGLTTFLADHLYEEEKGEGPEYRKEMIINYQSYVHPDNEFPLEDFKERTSFASEAIGYGKALMVFEMLRTLVGPEKFHDAICQFTSEMSSKKASWSDVERVFESAYGRNLRWFFHQWIDEKGLPEISLEDAKVRPVADKFEVAFQVVQGKQPYILDLPVTVHSSGGKIKRFFHVTKGREQFVLPSEDLPVRIAIDEDYEVGRKLSPAEFPPVVARLIGDERLILVPPISNREIYDDVIHAFTARGALVKEASQVSFDDLKASSFVLLGLDNPWIGRLYGSLSSQSGFSVVLKENPWDSAKVVGIFDGRSEEEVKAAFPKIFHYGKYSELFFDHGTNVHKKIDPSSRGITEELLRKPAAVGISTLQGLPAVIEDASVKKIVYVGETHNQFSHHVMELEIIKALHRRGRPIAVGMEMFQRPFQKVLDDYIEGRIDEKALLKGTEYFKRWGIDYSLYRPILIYARQERIPIIALNIRKEIAEKVFRGGLDSLTEEERKSLPSQMDFSDEAYKERLRKTFLEHRDVENFKTDRFDFFYEAQILWDETMAESVDLFLKTHPNVQMVVLAGSGHLAYGSGIPKRAARRNGYDYSITLNDADLEEGVGDFVLFPGTLPGGTSPKLMIFLKEEAGKVEIAGFPEDSPSEKAGLKIGDMILAIDHQSIHSIEDVHIELLSQKKGEPVKLKILRKGFLGLTKEMDFRIMLH
jgi:aminopeptidase N